MVSCWNEVHANKKKLNDLTGDKKRAFNELWCLN